MTGQPRSIVVIGATSAIAEHTLRVWLAAGAREAVLVGRSAQRLEALAADLRLRFPGARIRVEAGELGETTFIEAVVDRVSAEAVIPDTVLIAHGSMPEQEEISADLALAREVLEVNGVSVSLWAEAFATVLAARATSASIGVIGSVAGDRGRRKNYSYGAAKAMIEGYAEGLQHRLAGTGVRVVLIKPGPTATPMTEHLRAAGGLAPVADVAAGIVAAMDAGRRVAYVPAKWRVIMAVVRAIPSPVFERLNF